MSRPKSPAALWYFGDWQRDTGLQACSYAARGLWKEMLCIMHDGVPRGYLRTAGQRIDSPSMIASMTRAKAGEDVQALIAELESNGVFSRDADGTIFCRRMVRDSQISASRREAGKRGGETTQAKLRRFVAESARRGAAEPEPESRPQPVSSNGVRQGYAPSTAPSGIADLTAAKQRAIATVRAFQSLPRETKAAALTDLRSAGSVAEVDTCLRAVRQQELRAEIEARIPQEAASAS